MVQPFQAAYCSPNPPYCFSVSSLCWYFLNLKCPTPLLLQVCDQQHQRCLELVRKRRITCPAPSTRSGTSISVIWMQIKFEKHGYILLFYQITLPILQNPAQLSAPLGRLYSPGKVNHCLPMLFPLHASAVSAFSTRLWVPWVNKSNQLHFYVLCRLSNYNR